MTDGEEIEKVDDQETILPGTTPPVEPDSDTKLPSIAAPSIDNYEIMDESRSSVCF